MNSPPPHELHSPERPVRSDYSRDRTYARRRLMTICVLALILGGAGYAFFGRSAPSPSEIPTIHAEGEYRQKPEDPGGIDIPNQDVRVYEQLEGKSGIPRVEHLLPPPETPKVIEPPPSAPVPTAVPETPAVPLSVPPLVVESAPVTTTVDKPQSPPPETSAPDKGPVPVLKKEAAPKKETGTLTDVIAKINQNAPVSEDKAVLQLASVPGEGQAQALLDKLRQKYAAQLGKTSLRLVRADLGSKGVYYRVQSEPLVKEEAARICAALKKSNAGCILVGK